ncbi:MAG TPA: ribbon-helix-helix domain-containing protein [Dongiaceae bacterium]|jgi:predicted DNA-binding ribbon-helix-helix protein|nr:ribbon-helix-helix domain-containing protein [Dongiaceae bacterium]
MGAAPGYGGEAPIAGSLRKRSVTIAGHRTSISLEPEFWAALEAAAAARGSSLARLIGEIDRAREQPREGGSLSSALRVFLLAEARQKQES